MLYLAFFISIFRFEPNDPADEPADEPVEPNELVDEDNNNNLIHHRQFVSFFNNNEFNNDFAVELDNLFL